MHAFKIMKIGNLGKVITGRTPSTEIPEYFNGNYPFITIPDLGSTPYIRHTEKTISEKGAEILQNILLPPNSVVMSCIATIGKCGITTKPSFTNQQINSVICDEKKIYPLYLYYLFTRLKNELDTYGGGGSVYTNISKSRFENIEVKIPSLQIQQHIIEILGTLDDKIELNRRMNQTLESMARILFKSWFVDFDPVVAKMEGRDYSLPAEIMDLFPNELVESELGLIPKGWKISTINEVVDTIGGGTPSTKDPEYWDGGIHHFATPKDLSNLASPILIKTERKITDAGLMEISSGLLERGTLLMSSRAPVGYLAVTDIPICINQGFIAMKCNKNLSNFYMLNWVKHNLPEIKGRASGTTFTEINKKTFRMMRLIRPSKDVLNEYDRIISLAYKKITINLYENDNLMRILDSLLPKLINRELDILNQSK